MYVPAITPWLNSKTTLEKRKGGGKGGRGSSSGSSGSSGSGSSGSSSGGSSSGGSSSGRSGSSGSSSSGSSSSGRSGSSSSSSSSSSSRGGSSSVPIRSGGTSSSASSSSKGISQPFSIPAGQPFAGRTVGGGTRDQIYGTRQYGSGYPGVATAGVAGRGFPFGFWPLSFGIGGATGLFLGHHIADSREYGDPNNSTRPGGVISVAAFQPSDGSNTYRIMADNNTVTSLIPLIQSSCSPSSQSTTSKPFANATSAEQVKPEQIIQYYRASSIALSLDGYNNSAVFSNDSNAKDTPLPAIRNQTFLDCLNKTIGDNALLLQNSSTSSAMQLSGTLTLFLVVLHMMKWII